MARLVRSPPIPFPLPGYIGKLQFSASLAARLGPCHWVWPMECGQQWCCLFRSGHEMPSTINTLSVMKEKDTEEANRGFLGCRHCVRSKEPGSLSHCWEVMKWNSCLILCNPVCCVGRMIDNGSGMFGGNGEMGFPWSGKFSLTWSLSSPQGSFLL